MNTVHIKWGINCVIHSMFHKAICSSNLFLQQVYYCHFGKKFSLCMYSISGKQISKKEFLSFPSVLKYTVFKKVKNLYWQLSAFILDMIKYRNSDLVDKP